MNLNRLAGIFLTIGLALPSHAALQFEVTTNGTFPSGSLNGIAYDNANTLVAVGDDFENCQRNFC